MYPRGRVDRAALVTLNIDVLRNTMGPMTNQTIWEQTISQYFNPGVQIIRIQYYDGDGVSIKMKKVDLELDLTLHFHLRILIPEAFS